MKVDRELGGGEGGGVCADPVAFLGVANTYCLHDNLPTAVFLLGVIVILSVAIDHLIRHIRKSISCPQLGLIVNRIFEELMILGFISMVIFTLNTSGAMSRLPLGDDDTLSSTAELHLYEFFHYLVFLTMMYYILIVLLLLFIGTVVPKLVWEIRSKDPSSPLEDEDNNFFHDDVRGSFESDSGRELMDSPYSNRMQWMHEDPNVPPLSDRRPRNSALKREASGMDLALGSKAYSLLLQRYQREGWSFRFNLKKQYNLWKSFELLAYNICQHRSGYIYKNPEEVERLFGVDASRKRKKRSDMTYDKYHVLCMRNLLFHISELHPSALLLLLVICILPSLYPDNEHYIFIGIGVLLLFTNVVIFFKVLHILKGIVDDRLRVISINDIQERFTRQRSEHTGQKKHPSFKSVATAVRAVIRMQMSVLCHSQLHHHDDRFWFHSPRFLLRLFQFATIGQAFYLTWMSLVEGPAIANSSDQYLLFVMILLPALALFIITPLTMPSLVLVMGLTGIFVDLNTKSEDVDVNLGSSRDQTRTHIRLLRRSFLRSHHTDDYNAPSLRPSGACTDIETEDPSPSHFFLRVYDSPQAAAAHQRQGREFVKSPPTSLHEPRRRRRTKSFNQENFDHLLTTMAASSNSIGSCARGEKLGYSKTTRAFDLASFQRDGSISSATSAPEYPTIQERTRVAARTNFQPPPSSGRNWSQAGLDLPEDTMRRVERTSSREERRAGSNQSNGGDFHNYCSKYGGYADM